MGGDLNKQPRCGAKVKSREGTTCQQVAMANRRCYWHAGKKYEPKNQRRSFTDEAIQNKTWLLHKRADQ